MSKNKLKIINAVGGNYPQAAKEILSSLGEVKMIGPDQKILAVEIVKADVLVLQLGVVVTKEIINLAPNLKVIATATTGLDHVNVGYAKIKKIKVISLRGETEFLNTITSTAELAFGLAIALARHLVDGVAAVKNYQWESTKFTGHSLSGKTLGLVGLGRLGKIMARYGNAFGMKVIACDPYLKDKEFIENHCQKVEFSDLLSNSDIISIHVHLNEETKDMFNAEAFARVKNTAYLINTARGDIVNEKDLLQALTEKKIAGFAADVLADELNFKQNFSSEPLVEYAQKNSNVIITPHIGGSTFESRQATDVFIAKKVQEFFNTMITK